MLPDDAAWPDRERPEDELAFLRLAAQRGQLTGAKRFRATVARRTGRRIECRAPGRPRKTREQPDK